MVYLDTMKDEEKRKAARRRWYYKNRTSTKEPKPRVPSVPLMSVEDRKEILRENVEFAREGLRRKSEEIQRRREERKCVICGGPVLVKSMKAKSCSKACAKIARRKDREDWEKDCANCGKQCTGTSRYCDECNANEYCPRHESTDTIKDAKALRKFVIHKRGTKCESCTLEEWLGFPISLEIHHIDGDSSNNAGTNLQLLCPNCHSLTPTFRAKNRNASAARRKVRKTKEFAPLA